MTDDIDAHITRVPAGVMGFEDEVMAAAVPSGDLAKLLRTMRDETLPAGVRFAAAAAALPLVHTKPAPIVYEGPWREEWRPRKADRPRCGAKTRTGKPCQRPGSGRGGRCRNHGGMSTGPRTPQGLARSAANLQRWRAP